MSKSASPSRKYLRGLFWVVVLAAAVYVIVQKIHVFGNVFLVVVGFGGVILVHEFGHFIVAKLSGIKVEAFSIGFPPTLIGIRKIDTGYRIRILPGLFPKEDDPEDGRLSFTIGTKARAGETEYRLGPIPGGYVKMLGQEDIGPVKTSDDPRSFANKPLAARVAVIAAGVVFNVISAAIVFIIVFLIGIRLPPPVIGAVVADSPAARAGLRPGDEVIEIAGESENLDFSSIAIAAALSDKGEQVALKVRHPDGSIEDYALVAEQLEGAEMRLFGIAPALSLTIAEVSDFNRLYETTGLLPGDRIKKINDTPVGTHWKWRQVVQDALVPTISISAERTKPDSKNVEIIQTQLDLVLPALNSSDITLESSLRHVYSMVPRLRIEDVTAKKPSNRGVLKSFLRSLLGRTRVERDVPEAKPGLESGDIIVEVGDVENPTYKEFREVVTAHKDKKLLVKILRKDGHGGENSPVVIVQPRLFPDVNEVLIGINLMPALDAGHPIVAKTIAVEGGPEQLEIPRGAVITAVGGVKVSDFYEVIREIKRYPGERITIDWRLNEQIAGDIALDVGDPNTFITVKSTPVVPIPFEDLKRLYQADGPAYAIVLGYQRTIMFIAQTYVTIKRLASGLVSPKNLMGPVGIATFSYRIVAEQPLIYYLYWLGIIGAFIAVFNFLPLPPLDGGLIVLLLIEKIKGSALSERTQGVIAYTGWVLIGALFLYVTFNDIVNRLFG